MSATKISQNRPATRSKPTWDYDPETGILRVFGDDFHHDLQHVRELIDTGEVPWSLDTIIHQTPHVGVPMLVRGHVLSEWMIDPAGCPDWIWHFETKARRSA